jgi:hypothetical protein
MKSMSSEGQSTLNKAVNLRNSNSVRAKAKLKGAANLRECSVRILQLRAALRLEQGRRTQAARR